MVPSKDMLMLLAGAARPLNTINKGLRESGNSVFPLGTLQEGGHRRARRVVSLKINGADYRICHVPRLR